MAGSGANNVRLAKINPILGSGRKPTGSSLLKPSYLSGLPDPPSNTSSSNSGGGGGGGSSYDRGGDSNSSHDRKRKDYSSSDGGSGGGDGRKKRRSRWGGDENDKTFIPGMPTILPTNLNKDQEEAYLIQLQIEDYSRRLRSGDLGIPSNPEQRSPSPEPIYSSDGKRLNTRDYRTRRRLEDDRHKLIQKMFELNPDYKPPLDYKPPTTKVTDKIVIPQEEHPEINFVGLLIGPRGNTLKSLEKESGAKIIIRGKGSVKEGKVGRKDGLPMPGEDEPLHALISSINPECVKRAVDRIKEIIRQGVEVPEGQNDLRRNQLRELALLNGTLREQDGPRCNNCGATSHKSWQCPDKPNVTNNVICNSCGGAGHIARDCRQRRGGDRGRDGPAGDSGGGDRTKIDEEYMSLMAELGEGPPPRKDDSRSGSGSGYGGGNLSRYSGRTAFERREPPRPLMGPLTGSNTSALGTGDGSRANRWGSSAVNSSPAAAAPRSLLSQPPPLTGQPATGVTVSRQPPPGWGGPANTQAPPPPARPGPPPAGPFNTAPPTQSMFQAPPPPPPPPSSQGGGPPLPAGPAGSGWRAPWQQQPPPMSAPPPPGPVPPPRPVGPPSVPPPSLYPWQQFGAPPPPPQPSRPQPDLNMLAQAGLPNLLAAPPPPPPS